MEVDPLTKIRVLIVEDDYSVAKSLRWLLLSYGADIVGPAASTEIAMSAIQADPPDVAVLDVSLRDEDVFSFAAHLQACGVPFVFLTGHEDDLIPENLRDWPKFDKPVPESELVSTLRGLATREIP